MTNSYNLKNRKLTDEQANEIRIKYRERINNTIPKLAEKYGVSQAVIRYIIHNKRYNLSLPESKEK